MKSMARAEGLRVELDGLVIASRANHRGFRLWISLERDGLHQE